jgi:biopolymer transport protein ExbD
MKLTFLDILALTILTIFLITMTGCASNPVKVDVDKAYAS